MKPGVDQGHLELLLAAAAAAVVEDRTGTLVSLDLQLGRLPQEAGRSIQPEVVGDAQIGSVEG